jgi:asparagine synthase (glutamine-hydrolysing)
MPQFGFYLGWVVHENSVVDGQQFANETGDIVLVLAGECFADKELHSKLKIMGHQFEDQNNSWLVHAYEEKGIEFLKELSGCFSGLLVDKRVNEAILFNDRYGMERIYYYARKEGFYFASEAKALLQVKPELRSLNNDALVEYLGVGCCLQWKSLFRSVNILPGGSCWKIRASSEGCEVRSIYYFYPSEWENQPKLSVEDYESKFFDTFTKIIPLYLESSDGIGFSLTGGLDTRMIATNLSESDSSPVAYTFCGKTGQTIDARIAASVAAVIGLKHHLLRIEDDFFSDFEKNADRTVFITDGTLWVCGAHEIYLNYKARSLATVRLTGDFGSEILRGTSTFKLLSLTPELFSGEFRGLLEKFKNNLNQTRFSPVSFAAFKEIPWNLFGTISAARSQLVVRTPYLHNDLVNLAFKAPKNLRISTQLALNLIKKKSEALSSIPTDRGELYDGCGIIRKLKRIYSASTFKLDYILNEGMPNQLGKFDGIFASLDSKNRIIGSHKYLFYRRWFRRELFNLVQEKLLETCDKRNPIWNTKYLSSMAERHRRGDHNNVKEINAVLTIDAIDRLLLKQPQRN